MEEAALVAEAHTTIDDINMINALATSPLSLAFFDFRLSLMSYHTLLAAVPNLVRASPKYNATNCSAIIPSLTKDRFILFKERIQKSVSRHFNEYGATVTGKNNRIPISDATYRLITDKKDGLKDPEWQLRRYPLDLIAWPVKNSQRIDVTLDPDWSRCTVKDCGGIEKV